MLLVAAHASAEDIEAFDTGLENHAGLVFSPDGETAYWTAWNGKWGSEPESPRTIYSARFTDGAWSEPSIVAFSGTYNDDDPFVSPDGEWLYFVSDRPAVNGGDTTAGDIWRYRLASSGKPERLGISSEAAEYSPVITDSDVLYFASARDGGAGQGDIYRALPDGDGFAEPELLGPAINSATGEWNVWVSADETEMLFEASSRPTNVSIPGDLYYSRRTDAGWADAVPVSGINSMDSDLLPPVHGDTLFYTTAPIGGHARIAAVPVATAVE